MSELVAGTAEQLAFLEELTANGLLIPSGVPGVYGRGTAFESLRLALDSLVTRSAIDDVVRVERMAFPPVIPRRQLEAIGYLGSFPHLAGSIFSFTGDEDQAVELAEHAAAHEDWSSFQSQTDLVLVPAACYPSYPAIAARGDLPDGGPQLHPQIIPLSGGGLAGELDVTAPIALSMAFGGGAANLHLHFIFVGTNENVYAQDNNTCDSIISNPFLVVAPKG